LETPEKIAGRTADGQTSSQQPAAIGRLAPSPTGALHLGNARTFLLAWLSIRQQAGQIVFRIEDLDSPRVKPWAIEQTLQDLQWLGLDWDRLASDSEQGLHATTSRQDYWLQSDRLQRYEAILQQLQNAGKIYPCLCTRSDVAAAASAPHENSHSFPELEGVVYPGTCRELSLKQLPKTEKYCWRWRFESGEQTFRDVLRGTQAANAELQLGDFVIARVEHGRRWPAYQLAVVVDDFDQGITEVVRGDDLLFSTFRQLAILQFLDWPIPIYIHVPLMVGGDGRRLAKRHGDTRLCTLREQGVSSQAVAGYLAFTLGLIAEPKAIEPASLIGHLNWSRLPRQATSFDLQEALPLLRQMSR
jgi:glutamyl-tRNA synthetase